MVPWITQKGLARLIKNIHLADMEFNYLLNSTCIDNRETTSKGYRSIRKLLDWLSEIGADSVTVSMPFLCELIRKHYPHFKVKVSAFACVHNIHQVKSWENIGADMITLEPQTMNREFVQIENITHNCDTDIQLIVNQGCLYSCPNVRFHSNLFSHSSQKNHFLHGFMIDYHAFKCRYMKLDDPVNFIRSDWIRPEDLSEYETIGVKHFKIIQRNWTTEKIKKILTAYSLRRFDGNFAELSEFLFGENIMLGPIRKAIYFFRPLSVNLFHLRCLYMNTRGLSDILEIDNRKLDGFINRFKNESCREKNCEECRYCHETADRTVKILDKDALNKLLENLLWFLDRKKPGR
jgi:collagenase-like PrtC family protease